MKKRKNRFLQYKESWKYIKESRNFILIAIAIFFVFALIGFFIPAPEPIAKEILKFIQEIIEKTKDMSTGELTAFIFLNNLQTSFFVMIFGFLFGIFPTILAAVNGYILGFVASLSVENQGFFVLWRIFPHGIFELPAVFISLGLGLKLGSFIFKKEKMFFLKEYLLNSLKVFFLIVVPLLIIAAIIEGILVQF